MTLNKEKFQYPKERVTFLGQIIDGLGVHPNPSKVSAVKNVRDSSNVSDVCRFLGMTKQLNKFVPNLPDKTKPLKDLLCKSCLWTWEQPQQEAFGNIKKLLSNPLVLALYGPILLYWRMLPLADSNYFQSLFCCWKTLNYQIHVKL